MKVITHINEQKIDFKNQFLIEDFFRIQKIDLNLKKHNDSHIEMNNLLKQINDQFNLIYKENKKRNFLLKEISFHLIQK